MEQIIKMIEAGYIDFNYEVQNETSRKRLPGYTDTKTWGAIITKYQTCKEFNRNFFDFVDNQVEVALIKTGDVINLRNQVKDTSTYCYIYDGYYLITAIANGKITMESYPTVAKAVKSQKMMNSAPVDVVPMLGYPISVFPGNQFFIKK